ncbi:hypothetical protein Rfer_4389 (plasmid) [Rhodoferax ferrireducens T118]|uniref:Sulfotransferase n=1 Tax=Albidiferax ferrireducens (strain ATCC BAA-621 / DSM 15236 / T118) TaxID=338969 RepID=Q21Q70_ALBFT|nr:sulfotransferase [Rhodoferax ferrireducens]ABD72075.1 hypothetical protein Rfer_4389 [Rhodoferax ferrireducens T118]
MYLFLAVPNFCGSTLLHSLLETCPSVVPLTDPRPEERRMKGMVEGNCCAGAGYRNLNGPHSIEANMEHVYANPANYDWPGIRKTWDENWAKTNPDAPIRMQKTPADVFRVEMIEPHFQNLKWIISVRNPYAYVEHIMRKATFHMDPLRQLDQICYHVLRTMVVQIKNRLHLGDRAYTMTYEDFIARPEYHSAKLGEFLPGLEAINFDAELMVKGERVESIRDRSEMHIQELIADIPDIVERINEHFRPVECVLKTWGYELRKA